MLQVYSCSECEIQEEKVSPELRGLLPHSAFEEGKRLGKLLAVSEGQVYATKEFKTQKRCLVHNSSHSLGQDL